MASESETDYPPLALDDPHLEEPIPIPLNVLVSPKRTRGRAMRLLGSIGTCHILVFVDSGTDLNFLNPAIATSLSLDIDLSMVEPVAVANGRLCYTKGVARNVSIYVQDYVFSSDIRFLSVMGYDLVIGVEWLESLGYIGWHFKHKIMEFQVDGTNYRSVGLHSPDTPACPHSSPVVFP